MFAPYCPNHGHRVLLFVEDIVAVDATPLGIEVTYRCWCGYEGVWLSGRPVPERAA